MDKNDKTYRILYLYDKLARGELINKAETAQKFRVDKKSIQRDVSDINEFLSERRVTEGIENEIVYDRALRGYHLEYKEGMKLSNAEVLAVAKILLDSRAFTKKEMMSMMDRLVSCCVPPDNLKLVNELIANEKHHYIEPRHGKIFIDKMWEIGKAIREKQCIEITYQRLKDPTEVTRIVHPLAIMFSEFYFYMAAHIEGIDKEQEFTNINDMFPTIYRIDRIKDIKILDRKFHVAYKDRFEEGEYRKRIQFMQGGKIQRTTFWYKGLSIEAVLDRLPTAQIIREENGKYLVRAETFGQGIDMWLRSQGDLIKVVELPSGARKNS